MILVQHFKLLIKLQYRVKFLTEDPVFGHCTRWSSTKVVLHTKGIRGAKGLVMRSTQRTQNAMRVASIHVTLAHDTTTCGVPMREASKQPKALVHAHQACHPCLHISRPI